MWHTVCSACGTRSEWGNGYWHLMRCEPWLLLHHPLRDEEGEVVEPRTIDHQIWTSPVTLTIATILGRADG